MRKEAATQKAAPRRIALQVAYDGTDYVGWQRQNNGQAVQQVLEDTVEALFGEKVHMVGSGRTDAGVHARGQVAAMTLHHPIPEVNLLQALNSNLPDSIRILRVQTVPEDFHPQFAAKRKTYRYTIYQGPVMLPEYRYNAVLVPFLMDWDRIAEMLHWLEGEHDFAAFQASGGTASSTIRTIDSAKTSILKETDSSQKPCGTLHAIEITGNGFLYHMVRIIAGTAIEVGSGKRPVDCVKKALQEKDRDELGITAPAKGLTLMNVEYEPALFS